MTDNELLLAISEMSDKKLDSELKPIKNDLTAVKLTLENNIAKLLKKVVSEHSEKLQKIS